MKTNRSKTDKVEFLRVGMRGLVYSGMTLKEFTEATRQLFIDVAVEAHGGHRVKAARAIGVHRNTLSMYQDRKFPGRKAA
jgi:transcriptional regulator with PAS, ATPase and Fis domain